MTATLTPRTFGCSAAAVEPLEARMVNAQADREPTAARDSRRLRLWRHAEREPDQELDRPGERPACAGARPGCPFLSRSTSEGSSSRQAPGSSPSSVRPA